VRSRPRPSSELAPYDATEPKASGGAPRPAPRARTPRIQFSEHPASRALPAGRGADTHRVAPTLDLIVQPRVAATASLAADRYLLAEAARTQQGVLRVFELAGEVLSLGRYHLAPPPVPGGAVQRWRRHSGGRAFPAGEGFLGLSLVLSHRSAIVGDDPFALAPEQVMNRYVRGILEGLRLVGVPAFYPGRDLVTVDGRPLGLVAFEVDRAGALLFEAIVANGRDPSVLPGLLDRVDPGGVVSAAMLTPDAVTSIRRVRGAAPGVDELAESLRRGYEERLAVTFQRRDFSAEETRGLEAAAMEEYSGASWLGQRVPRAELDRRGSITTQLGVLEAHFALDGDRIHEIVFAGDFIANSPAVERLEHELRGSPAAAGAIETVVRAIFGRPENYILGIGSPRTVADAVARGLPP
jgi:lipoate-protein ligase A